MADHGPFLEVILRSRNVLFRNVLFGEHWLTGAVLSYHGDSAAERLRRQRFCPERRNGR